MKSGIALSLPLPLVPCRSDKRSANDKSNKKDLIVNKRERVDKLAHCCRKITLFPRPISLSLFPPPPTLSFFSSVYRRRICNWRIILSGRRISAAKNVPWGALRHGNDEPPAFCRGDISNPSG